MGQGFKAYAVAMLVPIARLRRRLAPLTRLWSHARLRERITSPLDPSVVVLATPEIHGTGRLRLGRGLYLYPGLYFETQEEGTIEIGDEVVMSRGVHVVAFHGIRIGAGSMIGEYSSVRDANHRRDGDQALRWAGHESRPIEIGRQVWIGRGVTILPGVTIGDGAVIGANAVVTHDIPAGAVAVGVPARVVGAGS
ncbi:transferase [Thiocapsa imhoffii]|uniref:Transferase n=1 Tax=Thiocapsa imhoffii TaxID=382777 RepID=A0A9X0WFJ8_9GAMM|nr:acyltransferase [Thiocapsa imhoffii]MBK1643673.1 transferase [Thiocapsa imhoffii]